MDSIHDASYYAGCSLENLYDIERHLDREKFPARHHALREEIKRREQGGAAQQTASSSLPSTSASPAPSSAAESTGCVRGCTASFFVGGVAGFGMLCLMLAARPGSGDAATGMGGLMLITGALGAVGGAIIGMRRVGR